MDFNRSTVMAAIASPPPFELIDEDACARAIGMSASWLAKDRRGKRLIPFYRVGGAVRYDPARVREALAAQEHGGGRHGH